MKPKQWVNDERTVLVSRFADGTLVVATRACPAAIWGPPVEVKEEAA